MEVETVAASDAGGVHAAGKVELFVLRASKEELAAHAKQLEEIDKASKGACLWNKP
jgi:hypothetical protein